MVKLPTAQTQPQLQTTGGDDNIAYSVVVPFYNERELVEKLYNRLDRTMQSLGQSYQLVLVNDGSTDGTGEVLERIAREDTHVLYVELRRNFGQTTALQAGFDYARGRIIVAMDGDGQHDPREIPMFLAKIERDGYDIASGWRVRRADNWLFRRLPSRMANRLLAKVSGVKLHDFGTTFKAYRREVLQDVRLYGDMHRFVPAICARLGAEICEVPIKNVPRRSGKSNYGLSRTFRVALDIITVRFITAYMTRPLHFFGKWGMVLLGIGGGILGYGLVRKLIQWSDFDLVDTHGPLMAVGFASVIVAMLLVATGLVGEMMMRVYFESAGARTYAVRRLIGEGESSEDESA
ncbi:MAG: glycosyltransferase family 2 protein [Phycisphaerae bacterium]